jgi:hypothetical protein
VSYGSLRPHASSLKEDVAHTTVQLSSSVPKMHAHDSVAVVSKGCTCLTSDAVTGKTDVACQHVATV